MRKNGPAVGLLCTILTLVALPVRGAVDLDAAPARHGWALGTQAWTFNKLTFVETLERAQQLGLKIIEFYPGQKFSAGEPFALNWAMTPAQREKVRQAAGAAGVRLESFGVVNAKDEEWPAVLQLARDMGVERVVCEPAGTSIAALDKLAAEAGIALAIHNHPKPSHYWDPEIVLKAIENTSADWSACADTGHWVRSGLNPVESLRKLNGKITELHFKDVTTSGTRIHDVPWGTGVNNVWAELAELKSQKFKGTFFVEYEHVTPQLMTNVGQSLEYFKMVSAAMDDEGWSPLLSDDLSNAQIQPGGWKFEDGVLTAQGKGDLWTRDQYGDFILSLDFRCDAPNTNSGIFLRCGSVADWLNTAIEVQILQQDETDTEHNTGAIFDIKAPSEQRVKPQGEWNQAVIIARANNIYAVINGAQVLHIDLDQWTEAGKNPDGSRNKFKYAYKEMPRRGFIGLQYHGNPVSFRNPRIKTLD